MRRLRDREPVTAADQLAIVAFLEMHRERGRHADRAGIGVPAVLFKADGETEDATLHLGGLLLLNQYRWEGTRISGLGIESWPWKVLAGRGLATGDGAVLLWGNNSGTVTTISFPLSPNHLLVIGDDLPDGVRVNEYLARNSRRWLVGVRGSLNLGHASSLAELKAREGAADTAP